MSIEKFQLSPGLVCVQLSALASSWEHRPEVQDFLRGVIAAGLGAGFVIEKATVTSAEANLNAEGNFVDETAVVDFANSLLSGAGKPFKLQTPADSRGCRPDPHYADHWIKQRCFHLLHLSGAAWVVGPVPSPLEPSGLEIPLEVREELAGLPIGVFLEWRETPRAASAK